ncbi:MAG: hypothetical protein QXN30_02315 [Metallosphaera sp.]
MAIELLEKEAREIHKIRPKIKIVLDHGVVTGAGDSYAACLTLEGKSRGKFRCVDPYELLDWEPPDNLVVVSVSGKPKVYQHLMKAFYRRSNILLVTANPSSIISSLANEIIEIPYVHNQRLPGTLSFVATLKVLYALGGYTEPEEISKPIKLGRNPFFVGKSENFGIAYFAWLKMAEVFGEQANAERLEQFLHSPIFSSGGRNVIVFSSGDPRELDLSNEDREKFILTECKTSLCNAETMILSLIQEMKERNWDKIYFLENEKVLRISSKLIY